MYLREIGLGDDPLLDDLEQHERNRVISAFAAAIRAGRFSAERYSRLVCSTVADTVQQISSTFRAHDRRDPRHDISGNQTFLLSRQYRGYRNQDPGEKHQKAITGSVLRRMHNDALTGLDKAISELTIGAFFFACRSCEYSAGTGDRRTKLLRLRNIEFRRNNRIIPHSDPHLERCETVSITFEYQKRDERDETITHYASGDGLLCPVRSWASVVQRILAYPGATKETHVNAFLLDGTIVYVQGKAVRERIRRAVGAIGKATLGYGPDDVGTHSLRSGAAMAMFLADTPLFVIMLQGRWSSDAFLRYIRKQVKQFSAGLSTKMIRHEHFYTIPSADRFDPRMPGHQHSFAAQNNIGRDTQGQNRRVSFHLNL